MDDLKTKLDALSAEATQGEWRFEQARREDDDGNVFHKRAIVVDGDVINLSEENALLIVALVNAYRTNQLITLPAEPDAAMVERVARDILMAHCEDMNPPGTDNEECVDNEWPDWKPEATAAIRAVLDHLRETGRG